MYFSAAIQSLTDLKKEYRKLAFQFHPDRGGNDEVMKVINAEYEKIFGRLKEAAERAERQEKEEKQRGENGGSGNQGYKERFDINDGYREMINKIIGLDVTIEIIGCWIWVSGNTKVHREELKKAGYTYSGKKIAWYWRPEEFRCRGGSMKDLDAIRRKYGSDVVNQEKTTRKSSYLTTNKKRA